MVKQVASMPIRKASHVKRLVEAERDTCGRVERVANNYRTVVSDGDEPAIKYSVEIGGKQDAVADVEPLGVRRAVHPRA